MNQNILIDVLGGKEGIRNPPLSLIITSYTAARLPDLIDLLKSSFEQHIKMELVIVIEKDEVLRDGLMKFLSSSSVRSKLIFSKARLGISNARSLGINNSQANILAFVDDDAILSLDWADRAIEVFKEHPEIIGATGAVLPMWIGDKPKWFPSSMYWMIGCTDPLHLSDQRLTESLSGVNMIFRRHAFDFAQFTDGFTDGAQKEGKKGPPNEDNDFALRLLINSKGSILYSSALRVFHKVHPFKLTYKYITKYAYWQGFTEARYNDLYGSMYRKRLRSNLRKGVLSDLRAFNNAYMKRLFVLVLTLVYGFLGYEAYKVLNSQGKPTLKGVNVGTK